MYYVIQHSQQTRVHNYMDTTTSLLVGATLFYYCLFVFLSQGSCHRAPNEYLYQLEAINPALALGTITGLLVGEWFFALYLFVIMTFCLVATLHIRRLELKRMREERR